MGNVYNDLKLDNLMVTLHDFKDGKTASDGNIFKNIKVILADFGYSTRYMDKNSGEHKNKVKTKEFRGNMLFASKHQLNFRSTARRDDLLSLFYLLVYMLHGGSIPGI